MHIIIRTYNLNGNGAGSERFLRYKALCELLDLGHATKGFESNILTERNISFAKL